MLRFVYVLLLLCFASHLAQSQNIEVTGRITDESAIPIPFPSVIFISQTDSANVHGALAEEDGTFKVQIPKDKYELIISLVGSQSQAREVDLTAADGNLYLGDISIQGYVSLDEVVVAGEREAIYNGIDKIVYQATKDLYAKGGTLSDLLQNLPAVQVTPDGGISIRGDNNITFLIDGQPSGLTSSAELLRSIPASSIEEIEIIINPSAKFVADGTAGILNVILKKGKEKRLNANVELFAGHRLNLGTNVNINKGGKKGSWFVNSGIGYSEPKGINDIDLDDLQSELLQTRQMSERFRDQLYYLVNAGGTLNLGERSSISGEANFRRVDLSNNIATQYQDFQSQTVFDTQQRLEEQSGNNNYYQGALTFNQKFKKEGHQMVIRLSTERTEEDESSTIETTDLSQGGLVLYNDRSSNDQSQSRSILSVDYTLPFAGNAKIELGYQGNIFDLDNDFTVERNTDNVWLLIPEFTDQTTFSQDVHAFYAQYAKKLNRFNLRLGLRTEITDIDFAAGQAADINKDFTDLFPFASVSYQLSDKTTLSYTINRRINRPPANALIPFNSFSDERNVFVGNPDLDPSYTFGNQLGLNTRLSAKLRLNAALYYRETTDELEFFVDRGSITINGEANDVYLSQLANIGTYYSFGLQSGIISNLAPWLNMYTGLIFNGFEQVGTLPNANFDGEGLLFYGRHNINITVRKAYKIQILNNYRGPIETGQYRRDGIYTMGLGISKDVFGGRGALVFNVSDVFNSGILNITTFGNDFLRELRLQNRVRQINVSLTYNFNQNAYKGKKGNQFDEVEVVR